MQAQSLGAYLARYFAGSGYVDAVAQITHYRNKYGDVYRGQGVQNGYGAGMSLEAGQPFTVAGLFAVEPQMQLMYQYTHLNHFDDSVSSVSGNTTHALRGRAGIRLFKANMADASGSTAAISCRNCLPVAVAVRTVQKKLAARKRTSPGGTCQMGT